MPTLRPWPNKNLILFSTFLTLILGFTSPKCFGDVVLSNLSNGSNYSAIGQFTSNRAVAFQTNGSTWNMTNFSFAAYANSTVTTSFTLRLYAASSASPYAPTGVALQEVSVSSITLPIGVSNASPVSINTSNWALSANTNYALEIESGSNLAFWAKKGTTYDTSTFMPLGNLQFNSGTWNPDNLGSNLAYSISANNTAIPEPATIIMFSLCLVGALLWKFVGPAN